MSNASLLMVIAIGTFVIVGVAVTGFIIFSRFLRSDKEKADRLEAIRLDKPDEPNR
ncbi:hypothetical protein [Fimbriimonas ginsengisoli]|uniref:Uncharacterized protein n=1 Tax=Fimbriimonas ginsengisoli Gsoil 348 TaxID=661478 RepID=A0A068NTM7_FIMGI|nr:hypothetical protein [Fimbriimonas ginsengisoli]AIE86903.1 hypothetical protein OP10G_3535 [Fimbriimonas ginsengisoli Gsoil 348]